MAIPKQCQQSKGKRVKDSSFGQAIFSGSTNGQHMAFSFQFLSPDYCISQCENKDKLSFVKTLKTLGTLTWQQTQASGRHQSGYETIQQRSIKAKMPASLLKDKNDLTFIAFRFSDKKSIVGFREHQIFHIVWVDRDFSVYNHE